MGHSRVGGASAPSGPACLLHAAVAFPSHIWGRSRAAGAPPSASASGDAPRPWAPQSSDKHPSPRQLPMPEPPGRSSRQGRRLSALPAHPDLSSALSFRLGSPFPRGGTGPTRATEEEEGEMTKYLLSSRRFRGRVHWTLHPHPRRQAGGHTSRSHTGEVGPGPAPAPPHTSSVTSRRNRNPFLNRDRGPRTLPRKARAVLFPRSPREPRAQPAIEGKSPLSSASPGRPKQQASGGRWVIGTPTVPSSPAPMRR